MVYGRMYATSGTIHVVAAVMVCCSTAVTTVSRPARDTLDKLGRVLPPSVADNFDELIKAATATCEAIPLEKFLACVNTLKPPSTNIFEFRNNSRRVYRINSAHNHVDSTLHPLVVYVPGWMNTPFDDSSTTIVNSLLKENQMVLLLDTRNSFCRGYIYSVTKVQSLAHLLYEFIKKLHKKGFDVSSIHLIGFSLGAHVAGVTGKLVQTGLNRKLGRITGLDPAKPCFTRIMDRVEKRDADFVQIIHTSPGILGIEDPIGHVDVYVNGLSKKQPECEGRSITLECDHSRAWEVFSASVSSPIVGKQCISWEELVQNKCTGDEFSLGYSSSPKTRGIFLYNSEDRKKRQDSRVRVYNPFSFLEILHHL